MYVSDYSNVWAETGSKDSSAIYHLIVRETALVLVFFLRNRFYESPQNV